MACTCGKNTDTDNGKKEVVVIEKSCDKLAGANNTDKWIVAIILSFIFVILALPFTLRLTNNISRIFGFNTIDDNGKPTVGGIIFHGLIFLIIVRLLMH